MTRSARPASSSGVVRTNSRPSHGRAAGSNSFANLSPGKRTSVGLPPVRIRPGASGIPGSSSLVEDAVTVITVVWTESEPPAPSEWPMHGCRSVCPHRDRGFKSRPWDCGCVAQWLEHSADNGAGGGSNPSVPMRSFRPNYFLEQDRELSDEHHRGHFTVENTT